METVYRRRQSARWMSALLLVMVLAFAVIILTQPDGAAALPSLLLITLLQVTFTALTVRVDAVAVSVRYGVGWLGFSFPMEEIRTVETVRNPWYWGWGIRLTPRGWLFNLGGLDAVELTFASGRRVRIGSEDPEGLAAAIQEQLDARA